MCFFVILFVFYLLFPLTSFTQQAPGNPEQLYVTNDATSQNFRGIKLGDVTTPAANPQNRPEAIVLRAADLPLTAGETVLVPVQVNGFTDIAAFQFVLRFDPQVLHFEQVEVPAGGIMSVSNFGSFLSEFGELRAAYAAADAESVTDGSNFFTLRFTALQSGATLASTIRLDETDFPAEAYTVNIEARPIQLSFSPFTAVSGVNSPDLNMRAIPNPATDRTNLHFSLPHTGTAIIRVTDVQGRILLEHKAQYPAGPAVYPFTVEHPGIYFAELHTSQGTQTIKVVLGL